MILQLRIRNFAIIEDLQIEFHEGFNVLTGETGAGKSILLDALGLLLGERGSTDFVRHGETKAEIEGFFSFTRDSVVSQRLTDLGIECEDEYLLIRRELTIQGKSICRINGQMVTTAMLKQVGEALVNFHSQHDHHQLLQSNHHLFWLDAFAGKEIVDTLTEYQDLYHHFKKVKQEFEQLSQNEKEIAQRIDLLKYQIHEIDMAELEVDEDERLKEERLRLTHAEKIIRNVKGAHASLADEQRALDWLGIAMSHLEEITHLDPVLQEKFQQIEETFYILDDLTRELSNYADNNDFDPNRLEAIEDRLHIINSLKRKYGDSIQSIFEYKQKITIELQQLENRETVLHQLSQQLVDLKKQLFRVSDQLTHLRKKNGALLAEYIKKELADLYMEKADFFVQVEDLSTTIPKESLDIVGGEYGMNTVEFMISTNPGEPLKPMSKVASGGELSRLVLALRTVLARIDQVNTLVFDEVDTGVSGRITQAIGEKLLRIASDRQVLAITHHPQVASLADTHFLIEKHVDGERTKTLVFTLTEDERVQELARMIGGNQISSSARLHAAEMRRLGKQVKVVK